MYIVCMWVILTPCEISPNTVQTKGRGFFCTTCGYLLPMHESNILFGY